MRLLKIATIAALVLGFQTAMAVAKSNVNVGNAECAKSQAKTLDPIAKERTEQRVAEVNGKGNQNNNTNPANSNR